MSQKPKSATQKKNINTSQNSVFISKKSDNDKNQSSEDSSPTNTNTKTIEQRFQKKTQIEHILLRPDTYIGQITKEQEMMWIFDEVLEKIIKKEIVYVPGLYKIFDEILVNAHDHYCNDKTCDTIKVNIDKDQGKITVWNNGNGIPIVEHS